MEDEAIQGKGGDTKKGGSNKKRVSYPSPNYKNYLKSTQNDLEAYRNDLKSTKIEPGMN